MMDVGDAADQRILHRDDHQIGIAAFRRFDGVFKGWLGDRSSVRNGFAGRQIGIGPGLALEGDAFGVDDGFDHDKIFRAFSKSAGVSTDKGASSTCATAMLMPASSALSCSSFSRFSSG